MAKATELVYTDKEIEAINTLRANAGSHLTAEELGISTAILTSLVKKYNDPRPMADGSEKVNVCKEDCERQVTVTKSLKAYWID